MRHGSLFELILIKGMDAMSFKNLMNSYAARQQMELLGCENNKCTLTIDGRVEVSCFQANGRFYAYSVITKLPVDNNKRESMLVGLLERNLALLTTQRVSLCIDPDENVLGVYISASLKNLNVDLIEELIAALANNYELFLTWAGQGGGTSVQSPPAMMLMP